MSVKRDPRYDVLFDTVAIGPVTAPNRFYQVPHCNGMGRMFPDSMISMRGTKAEGGWGIVTTEQCDFHPTGDVQPFTETSMWDDGDLPYLSATGERIPLSPCPDAKYLRVARFLRVERWSCRRERRG